MIIIIALLQGRKKTLNSVLEVGLKGILTEKKLKLSKYKNAGWIKW